VAGPVLGQVRYRADRRWRQDRPCDVYVLLARDGDGPMYVKVGMSRSPESRLLSIQTGCPIKLVRALAFTCGNDAIARAAERAFHLHLAEHRSSGEWFRFQWGQDAKAILQDAIDQLMVDAQASALRDIDLGGLRRAAATDAAARQKAVEKELFRRANKQRMSVELRAPYPEP